MGLFQDLWGTTKSYFQIAIGGVKLENDSGNLVVKDNAGDESDITVKKAFVQGDSIELNSDAAGSAADWRYTLQRPATGMTEEVTITLPPTHGSPGQVLADVAGDGVLSFVDPDATSPLLTCDTTTLNWNSAAEVTMFNLPVGALVEKIKVIIDTAFDGTVAATMSVGTTGAGAAKYMASNQVNLKGTAKDVYEVNPGEPEVAGSPEALVITFAAASGGSPSAGSARVMVFYATPG